MTGEMSRSEVTAEAYPLHFAIARAFRGATVEPFDQYQGPFVHVPTRKRHAGGRVWVCAEDDSGFGFVYSDKTERKSEPFPLWDAASPLFAALAAREVLKCHS